MKSQTTEVNERKTGCVGSGLRVLASVIVLFAVLAFAGAVYEARAQDATLAEFPAPGQFVDVDGRTMHIHCQGQGTPTIILDAGQGGWSSSWDGIMPQLSQRNRVCAYDRAGYGWSGPAEDDRSPQDAAGDLSALLANAGVEPPYVLVGFSHAGLADRIFAAEHVNQMAGMVLIDPATEFDNEIMGPEMVLQQRSAVGIFNGLGLLARLGVVRLLGTQNMAGRAPLIALEAANPDVYYAFVAAPQWWTTSTKEFASRLNEDHLAQVRSFGSIPDIPLTIVGSDNLEISGASDMDTIQAARHQTMRAMADLSPQGEFIIAEGSTHNVLIDRPDAVVDAIIALMAAPSE